MFSLQAFAEDEIEITVSTEEKSAAAIGYTVEGKASGGPGKSYTGKGPINKEYVFGYRKDSKDGEDIRCGVVTLTKNTHITLVTDEGGCHTAEH